MGQTRQDSARPRVVVIGAGEIARQYHLPSLQYLAQQGKCELAAICDVRADVATRAAQDFGARQVYTDARTMLETEKPDGVLVYVPVPVTVEMASMVMRMGYPVLMEKPPGESQQECLKLLRVAEQTGVRHMVAFNRRFCPVVSAGRRHIAERGAIKGASARMFRKDRRDLNFFTGTGIHSLDALRFLAGDVESAEVHTRTLPGDARPSFTVMLEYVSGGTGVLEIRPQAGVQVERYELFGEHVVALIEAGVGWLIDTPGRLRVYEQNSAVEVSDPLAAYDGWTGAVREAACGGFFQEDQAFIEALHGTDEMHPTVAETIESVAIAEAAEQGRSWRRQRMW